MLSELKVSCQERIKIFNALSIRTLIAYARCFCKTNSTNLRDYKIFASPEIALFHYFTYICNRIIFLLARKGDMII